MGFGTATTCKRAGRKPRARRSLTVVAAGVALFLSSVATVHLATPQQGGIQKDSQRRDGTRNAGVGSKRASRDSKTGPYYESAQAGAVEPQSNAILAVADFDLLGL